MGTPKLSGSGLGEATVFKFPNSTLYTKLTNAIDTARALWKLGATPWTEQLDFHEHSIHAAWDTALVL